MAHQPLIGIPAPVVSARWGPWDDRALVVPAGYLRAVRDAGGLAVALGPEPPQDAPAVLDRVDGLLLIGGTDVDPGAYGQPPHPATDPPDAARDAFEVALVREAIARDLPLLAVCRGMQVFNVACGGTLVQHIPEVAGHEHHRRQIGSFADADHEVRLEAGTLAARVAGEDAHVVKSHHHQAVDVPGEGLVVTGRDAADGGVEAIERPASRFALGVQWHPEEDPDSPVIAALVEAARTAGA